MDERKVYGRYAHLGIQFALVIGLFMAAGYWADEKLGWGDGAFLASLALGFVVAMVGLVRAVDGKR